MLSNRLSCEPSALQLLRNGGRSTLGGKKFSPRPRCAIAIAYSTIPTSSRTSKSTFDSFTPSTACLLSSSRYRYRPGLPRSLREKSILQSLLPRFQGTVAPNQLQINPEPTPQSPLSSETPPPPPNPEKKRPLLFRILRTFILSAAVFTLGVTMAAGPTTMATAQEFLQPLTDAETLTLFTPPNEPVAQIEAQIHSHPLTQKLFNDPKFIASRPHLKIPEHLKPQNLTGCTLLGEDKIAVPPLQFHTRDGSEFVSLQYVGPALCGHPGIVHGGLLATLLDEGLARCCFPALPNKVGVTASLKIDYKKPCMAGQVVVLRAWTTKVEGRKAWVKGVLETLADREEGADATGDVLVEAEALFIEPRQAAGLMKVYSS